MTETAEKRRVVLGITGSIAAYKSAELARIFTSRGFEVRCIMTEAAQKFITPTLMESISGQRVVTDFWDRACVDSIEHIELSDWADVLLISPATADFIAKLNLGIADSPLLAIALATRAPIVIAPAMNVNMYEAKVTRDHIASLCQKGVSFVGPDEGELACGVTGKGRLSDPWDIFFGTRRKLTVGDFYGKKIIVTTGPTREEIDPVRFISNKSSGRMGCALAIEAYCRGADVTLIHGPIDVNVPSQIKCIPVITAAQMYEKVMAEVFEADLKPDAVIMAAAIADFRAKQISNTKIKRGAKKDFSLALEANEDILFSLGERRGKETSPILVGFAVETGEIDDLLQELEDKLRRKNVDIMIGNLAEDAFELDTNRVWILDKHGKRQQVSTTFKSRVSNKVLDVLARF